MFGTFCHHSHRKLHNAATAADAAARDGHIREVERILGRGAIYDGYRSANKATALHAAAAKGHAKVVAALIEVGGTQAKVAKNKFRQSPLDLATKYKRGDCVKLLRI